MALVALFALWPSLALAQGERAGVVTSLRGQASLSRPVIPQPIPLKFKDDLFLRDRVETREDSVVRVLLGGKALVTIRELSVFTITEEPGRAAVNLQSGTLALAVAKKLLAPGEVIEIRTPNAVAAVRGSLVVAQAALIAGLFQSVITAIDAALAITVCSTAGDCKPLGSDQTVGVSGMGAGAAVGDVKAVTPAQKHAAMEATVAPKPAEQADKVAEPLAVKISGDKVQEATVLASLLAPGPAQPTAPPAPQPGAQAETPPAADPGLAQATPPGALGQTSTATTAPVTTPPGTGRVSTGDIGVQATSATAAAQTAAPPPPAGPPGPTEPPPQPPPPAGPPGPPEPPPAGPPAPPPPEPPPAGPPAPPPEPPPAGPPAPPPPEPPPAGPPAPPPPEPPPGTPPGTPDVVLNRQTVVLGPGETLKTFTGTSSRTDPSPVAQITDSSVSGADNLFVVEAGADASLAGPLAKLSGASSLSANSSIVDIRGRLSGAGASALLNFDPVTVLATDFARVGPGAVVALAGSLLSDVGGIFSLGRHFLAVTGGGNLASTAASTLVELSGSGLALGTADPAGRFLFASGSGSSVSLRGGLLGAVETAIGSASDTVGLFAGAAVTTRGTADALASVSGGVLASGGNVVHARGFAAGGSMPTGFDLSGSVFSATGTAVTARNNLFRLADGGFLRSGALEALLRFVGGSFTGGIPGAVTGGSLLRMFSEVGQSGTSLLVAGPYLQGRGTVFASQDGPAFSIADGAAVFSTGPEPFASFVGGRATSAFSFFSMDSNTSFTTPGSPTTVGSGVPPTMSLVGTLIEGMDTAFETQQGSPFLLFRDGATLMQSGGASLVDLHGSAPGGVVLDADSNVLAMVARAGRPAPSLALGGSLVNARNARITTGDPAANTFSFAFVGDGSTLTGPPGASLLAFDRTDVDSAGNIVHVGRSPSAAAPSRLILRAPLFTAVNRSSFNTSSLGFPGGACCSGFFVAQGSELTSLSGEFLVQLGRSSFSAGPDAQSGADFFGIFDTFGGAPPEALVAPSTVSLAGGLLHAADGSAVSALFNVVAVGRSRLATTGPEALVRLAGTAGDRVTVAAGGLRTDPLAPGTTAFGRLLSLVSSASAGTAGSPASVELGGQFLAASNASVSSTSDAIGVFNGARLSSASPSWLLDLEATDLTAGTPASARHLLSLGGLGGPDGATLARVDLQGGFLRARKGSAVTATGNGLSLFDGSRFESKTSSAQFQVEDSTLTIGAAGSRLLVAGGAGVTPPIVMLRGPFLDALNAEVSTATDVFGVFSRSTVTSASANGDGSAPPFARLDHTNLTAGTPGGEAFEGVFLHVAGFEGAPSTFATDGSLLFARNGSRIDLNGRVIHVSLGGAVTGTGTARFVELDGSPLATANGEFLGIFNGSTVDLRGGLLAAIRSDLTLPLGLALISGGSRLRITGSTDAVASLTGGTHEIGTAPGHAMFKLFGRSSTVEVDEATGLPLGTDQPVQGGGPLLETLNATVTTQKVVRVVDAQLVAATAPILRLKENHLFSSTDAVDLSFRARVTSLGPEMILLDGSTTNVLGGSLVRTAGGSRLHVAGDLLHMRNAAALNITGGTVLSVSDGSVATIAGAFVKFGGTGGSVLSVSNNLAPTGFIGGIPVFSGGGGTTGFTLTGAAPLPGLNTLGNSIKINGATLPTDATMGSEITGSLIAIQNGGAVKIGP